MDTFEHDQNEILAELADPVGEIHKGLELGAALADEFFVGSPYHRDKMLDAHLIRYGACGYLRELYPDGWMLRFLHHSGVEAHKEPFLLKVTKSDRDTVQNPGPSLARRGHWSQERPQMFPNQTCVLLDWDLGHGREIILHLSKPTAAWRFGEQPELEWRHRVGTGDGHRLEFIPASEDIPIFDISDLEAEESLE